MNKETIFIGIVISIITLVFFGMMFDVYKSQKELKKLCQERELSFCSRNIVVCFDECRKLDKEYFKYDSYGGFGGSNECWCYDDTKNTVQIY